MLISTAYAQESETVTMTEVGADGSIPEAPSASEAFIMNLGMVLLLVVMFYLLLIKPQQKRLKEHSNMLQDLKKGDSVVTGGGLVGVIDKIKPGDPEVVVDLGGSKVTALRSTLQGKSDIFLKAENDKKAVKKDATKSEEPVKK